MGRRASVPLAWLLYLAAFDAHCDALARGDRPAADGARALMRQLHLELLDGRGQRTGETRELPHEVTMRELLDYLEGRY